MNIDNIKTGTRLLANGLVMVITGESDKAFMGYYQYKGKAVGQCSILKEMFTNPHYKDGIQILD